MFSALPILEADVTQTYQNGYIRCTKRKASPARWEFLWRETTSTGARIRRTAIVGTIEQYPTEASANEAANGIRVQINTDLHRRHLRPLTVSDVIDHYIRTDLSIEAGWHSHATRIIYQYFIKKWIRPQWGENSLHCVRTLAVEHWLRGLQNENGRLLANATKAKIRSVMSVLFNHAIRCEWLEQGKNPILFVRQSAKRKGTPTVLEIKEIQALLSQLKNHYRLMVMLAVTTGLRRSELFALKWCDVNFSGLEISVCRSVYRGVVGQCKTEASQQSIPISEQLAADLWLWKETTKYNGPDDWVFASVRSSGRDPMWPGIILQKVICPAAFRAGIQRKLGWHTFRHTYSTVLIANGENVKVVQELMRHSSSQFNLQIYTQAQIKMKRTAQNRLVEAILPDEYSNLPPTIFSQRESLDP
jgi:integrase